LAGTSTSHANNYLLNLFLFEVGQANLQAKFRAAMSKMAIIGHNRANMVDCSDVIPVPKPVVGTPHLPAGKTMADIEQAVSLVHPMHI
jgi:hypothetical protein